MSCLLAGCLFFILTGMARSFDITASPMDQFHHSAWSAATGAPRDVWSIAQGVDGSLWLGTGAGLYQFDGVKFRSAIQFDKSFSSSNITSLSVLPTGEILAGFYLGGMTLIKQGHATTYGKDDGFPSGWVLAFAQTQDGVIWAAARHGLARYENGRWTTIGNDWGFPPNSAGWVLVDKEGTLWASGPSSLLFLAKGSHRFQDTHIALGSGAVLALDRDDGLWVSDKVHGTRSLPGVTVLHPSLSIAPKLLSQNFITSNRMLFDRNGHMWGTDSQSGGVYIVLDPKTVADGRSLQSSDLSYVVNRKNGLTSDLTDPLLNDREGNVWVGTNFGLDSFRSSNVSVVPGLEVIPGVDFNGTVDSAGNVWILNGRSIYRVENAVLHSVIKMPETVHDLAGTEDGSLWFESETGIYRYKDGVTQSIPLPAGVTNASLAAFTSDHAGGIWASFVNGRLFHWSSGRWSVSSDSLIRDTPTALALANEGLWVGFTNNRVVVEDAHSARLFSSKDGVGIGAVSSFNVATSLKLVGGELGLARFENGKFQTLSSIGASPISGISGIVQSEGMFWLNTGQGVLRISALELKKAFDDSNYSPTYKLFQYRDGLPGFALQSKSLPTAWVDRDGQIWVATNLGIAWIDPRHTHLNRVPPTVEIVDVSSNGRHYLPEPHADGETRNDLSVMQLPKRTSNLAIEYSATSLSVPEGTRFRCRLDGVDEVWQDVGTRREAFYANLSPGTYTFQVEAENEDGVWSTYPASVGVTIPRMFYQTNLFIIACVAAVLIITALLFGMRLRQVADNVRSRLNERYAERERIARELHDTLLQSVQGLILSVQAAAQRVPMGEPARAMIDKALDRADDVLVEGRDRLLDLRTTAEQARNLPRAFALIGEELGKDANVSFQILVEGLEHPVDPMVREEIYRIGREAILNSYRHSDADAIEIEISHDSDELRVRFRDNGRGIGEGVTLSGGRPGHWGLVGMRERAVQMGGSLVVWGGPDLGTEIELKIPAAVAYGDTRPSFRHILRRLVKGGR
ncbi:signal transduction histidine kinase/ligand-binding sensor domain-containing protein [Rhodanobacter sp. ANJX3]|uniref:sensor histidine kinase n=1 Tax=unclassified Rhodanobacter TaxID=2621553 RepID=UPI0015CA42D7|nr:MULTISPECIES: sensor histidine kinase [unclassified Rhodanobacter]MBB5357467.1 signal transduction histidine kinase/ligand-binding sensor domain-containing protein [Rhodanobacter sp. ANJX3]NYE27516.1 signal transduction histidine kinase/ligand-binding sensor domain-containing protein [Rhodanobacter sp. K2T2]